jgi:CO/xanthine dehydrogenase Mo-binding subunit
LTCARRVRIADWNAKAHPDARRFGQAEDFRAIIFRTALISISRGSENTRQAARVIEAEYEYPTQSHASMGPACALADVRADEATIWTSTQKPYDSGACVAELLGMRREQVHSIWMFGTGSYGRNDQGDATADAAVLSKHLGRPVRVQYMRHEGLAWDPKSPASTGSAIPSCTSTRCPSRSRSC